MKYSKCVHSHRLFIYEQKFEKMIYWNMTWKPSSDEAINFTLTAINKHVLDSKNHVTKHFYEKEMEDIDKFVSSCVLFVMLSFVFISLICIFKKKNNMKDSWSGSHSIRAFNAPPGLYALTTTHLRNCTPHPHGFAHIQLHGNCRTSPFLFPQSNHVFLSDGFNMPPTDLSNIIENSPQLEKRCDICGEEPPAYEVTQRSTK